MLQSIGFDFVVNLVDLIREALTKKFNRWACSYPGGGRFRKPALTSPKVLTCMLQAYLFGFRKTQNKFSVHS